MKARLLLSVTALIGCIGMSSAVAGSIQPVTNATGLAIRGEFSHWDSRQRTLNVGGVRHFVSPSVDVAVEGRQGSLRDIVPGSIVSLEKVGGLVTRVVVIRPAE